MSSVAADRTPRFYTFWSINGALDRARLRRQLEDFRAAGLHGVVFHPRFYPGRPPYMSPEYLRLVNDSILHARELGLRYWLYDENGWPSGTGDGQVLARFPDSASLRLDLTPQAAPDSLGAFATDASNRLVPAGTNGARTWHLTPRRTNYVDSLEPRVLGHFLDLIHERYRTGLEPAAFEYVEAFFADEPEAGILKDPFPDVAGIPWTPSMPERLRAALGADFAAQLPLIFARGDGYQEVRVRYWEAVTDALIDGFFAPYLAWCRRQGKQFIAHVKGEEHPLFQLPMVGSCHRIFRHLSIPGIDALERHPALDFYPRQAAAASRQFSNGRCMVECFGGAGWGATPEDLERYVLWLGRNGLTDFVFHLSQYRLDTPALTDWPPSEPLHLSWREAFPELLARVTRELAAHPPAVPDTLVVAPYRGLMAEYEPWELWQTNLHVATTYPDTPAGRINRAFLARLEQLKAAGIPYDVTDERTLEEDGRLESGRLRLGQATYARVVVDDGARLRESGQRLLPPALRASVATLATRPAVSVTAAGRPAEPGLARLTWAAPALPENSWLIEPERTAPREYVATFQTEFGARMPAGLHLHFTDDLVNASLDGRPLTLTPDYEGAVAPLAGLADGSHGLRFRTEREFSARPYVWLKGGLTVHSRTPFTPGPNGTLRTAGPFVGRVATLAADAELAAAGLPFLHRPLVAEANFELGSIARQLRFGGMMGDAIRAWVDGRPAGWAWGPDWTLSLPAPLAAGPHRLRVELVPSTFNYFGPHHYYNGDWHVVSPGQIVGEKNFADLPDAPSPTLIPAWHFKPLRLPSQVIPIA
ncbi:MAG: hypothetical protein JSR48_12815 [Verrucomicrobia bacterium]|nr:hypothetical protein [Verrucomicrobiota bacterium]